MSKFYKDIPTREIDGTWTYTNFPTHISFREFVKSCFKEPGLYQFDETAFEFNKHATKFTEKGYYIDAPLGSKDYFEFWDSEREKCMKGVIFKGKDSVWYIPHFCYHWINFLQINNKKLKRSSFPEFRDVQYHMALYEFLASLFEKNAVVVKRRQVGSTYLHIAEFFNRYLFDNSFIGKIGASNKRFINSTDGCWRYLNEYKNFTNKYTPWTCNNFPDKEFSWQQRAETTTPDGRKVFIGTMSVITGTSLENDPKAIVGGPCSKMYYEEGGIAPTADQTYGFMRAAMMEGEVVTGMFSIAGSIGDLDECEPLKDFIFNPEMNDFYGVENRLIDDKGTVGITGLFVPQQWGMVPYIDEYGNSLVEQALLALDTEFDKYRKLSPERYQLEVSQKPRNLKEAFALRSNSIFPIRQTAAQLQRIENNEYAIEYVDLIRTEKNAIEIVNSDRRPITDWPVPMTLEDKRGIVCIHERPGRDMPYGTYIAAVDPVEVGKTTKSVSLVSIYIYKMDVEVLTEKVTARQVDEREKFQDFWGVYKRSAPKTDVAVTSHLEGGKLVAWWAGRFDDPNQTNEYISRLLELYNARVVCENNKTGFINYMILKKRQKHLVMKNELMFDKEMSPLITNSQQIYGITMTEKLKKLLLEYAVNSITEVLYEETDENGNVSHVHFGVERIIDSMLIKEMQGYQEGKNADRIITYCLLIAYVNILQRTGQIKKKVDRIGEAIIEKHSSDLNKGTGTSLFNYIGKGTKQQKNTMMKPRNPFRNIR